MMLIRQKSPGRSDALNILSRQLCLTFGLLIIGVVSAAAVPVGDYRDLVALLAPPVRSEFFEPYTEFAEDEDRLDHDICLDYLADNEELIARIRDDLGCEDIQWDLQGIVTRLLYVPEIREAVAEQFVSYSKEVVAELTVRTGLANPYHSISTVMEHHPEPFAGGGIRAIIVQDLAREYQARYQFSGDTARRIEIGLSGQTAIDEVGSYSSYLHYSKETGGWFFLRDRQTIWKSVSDNAYTVLMTPLEETLHIMLRHATEQSIVEELEAMDREPTLGEVEVIVERWLAVEEAVVGALVYALVPEVILPRIPDLPKEWIEADLHVKSGYEKYRWLPRAIDLAKEHGTETIIDWYQKEPSVFLAMLTAAD